MRCPAAVFQGAKFIRIDPVQHGPDSHRRILGSQRRRRPRRARYHGVGSGVDPGLDLGKHTRLHSIGVEIPVRAELVGQASLVIEDERHPKHGPEEPADQGSLVQVPVNNVGLLSDRRG